MDDSLSSREVGQARRQITELALFRQGLPGRILAWLRGLKAARAAERRVRAWFEAQHPGQGIAWVGLSAEEAERYVVAVFFGAGIPPSCRHFALSKRTGEISTIEDDSRYRPKSWG